MIGLSRGKARRPHIYPRPFKSTGTSLHQIYLGPRNQQSSCNCWKRCWCTQKLLVAPQDATDGNVRIPNPSSSKLSSFEIQLKTAWHCNRCNWWLAHIATEPPAVHPKVIGRLFADAVEQHPDAVELGWADARWRCTWEFRECVRRDIREISLQNASTSASTQFGQIHSGIWTNAFSYLDKYILHFEMQLGVWRYWIDPASKACPPPPHFMVF